MTADDNDLSTPGSRTFVSAEKTLQATVCLSPSSVVERIPESSIGDDGGPKSKHRLLVPIRRNIVMPLCWDKSIREQVQQLSMVGAPSTGSFNYYPHQSSSQIPSIRTLSTACQTALQEVAMTEHEEEAIKSQYTMEMKSITSELLAIKAEQSIEEKGTESAIVTHPAVSRKESTSAIKDDGTIHIESTCNIPTRKNKEIAIETIVNTDVDITDNNPAECCSLGSADSTSMQAQAEVAVTAISSAFRSEKAINSLDEALYVPMKQQTELVFTNTTSTISTDASHSEEDSSNSSTPHSQDIAVQPIIGIVGEEIVKDSVECYSVGSIESFSFPEHEPMVAAVASERLLGKVEQLLEDEGKLCPTQQAETGCRSKTSNLSSYSPHSADDASSHSASSFDLSAQQIHGVDISFSYSDVEEDDENSRECFSVGSSSSSTSNLIIESNDSGCLIGIHRPSYERPTDFDCFVFRPQVAHPQPLSTFRQPPSTITVLNTTLQEPGSQEAPIFEEVQQQIRPKKRFTPSLKVNTSLALAVVSEEDDVGDELSYSIEQEGWEISDDLDNAYDENEDNNRGTVEPVVCPLFANLFSTCFTSSYSSTCSGGVLSVVGSP